MPTNGAAAKGHTPAGDGHNSTDFVVPVIHTHLPESVVNVGFYGGLAAAVVVGAVELPLALLAGLGVAVARHRRA